ncbi:MAG TPA: chondroitinase-B domain-containing protein [Phycisphaerae bacterium]|nr:chondroitinase-B domain-containing protein [Phycisphaerae bacterium]
MSHSRAYAVPAVLALWLAMNAAASAAETVGPLSDIAAINKALAAARPGDTILIRNGAYPGDVRIVMTAEGEKDKPITLAAETPGKVFFTGGGTHQSFPTITLTGSFLHVTGFVFHKSAGGVAVHFRNARFSRLSHCAFNESGESRSVMTHMIEMGEDSADSEVDHCYMARSLSMSLGTRGGALRPNIHHNWWRDIVARASNGQEALQLRGDKAGQKGDLIDTPAASLFALVEYNLFDGACGDEEIISVKSNDNVIRHNTFLAHPTANKGGLNVRHAHRTVVDSNFFFGTGYGVRVSGDDNVVVNNYIERPVKGIRLTGGGTHGWAYRPCRNGLIANNTVIDAEEVALDIGTYMGMKDPNGGPNVVNLYPSGNRVCNNLFTCKRAEGVVSFPLPETGEVKPNDYRNNLAFCRGATAETLRLPEGFSIVDPQLAKEGRLFSPQADSPALGKALPLEPVKEDVFGRARGSTPDIGCEQVSGGAAAKRRPLTSKDVGPDWMKGEFLPLEKEAALIEVREMLKKYPDPQFRKRLHQAVDDVAK